MKELAKCDTNSGGWALPQKPDGVQVPKTGQELSRKNQLAESAFSASELQQIRGAIRNKYDRVARSADGNFNYPTGKKGAEALRYDPDIIARMPAGALDSFCGVGNPFLIDPIRPSSVILDIGCGAGFDLVVASTVVGQTGRVFGVDLTEAMLGRAEKVIGQLGLTNVEVTHVSSEALPFDENFFDVVISNGVINLSPCKPRLFREIFRVMKPGGRLQFADIVLEGDRPGPAAASVESWSQWIGGAIPVRDQLMVMEQAGFRRPRCIGKTGFTTSPNTVGALFLAECRKK